MHDNLPAAVTDDERALLGQLCPPAEYLRALLVSSWRQEVLLERIARAAEHPPVGLPAKSVSTKPRKPAEDPTS